MRKGIVIPSIILSLILILTAFPNISVATEDMVMSTPRTPDSPQGKWLALIYTEAFRRLGWNLVYKQYPSGRSAQYSNSGLVDGEMARVYSFNSKYPNLIRVDEPLEKIRFVAITADPSLTLQGWEDLKKRNFRINYRRGVKLFDEMLPKFVKPEHLAENKLSKARVEQVAFRKNRSLCRARICCKTCYGKREFFRCIILSGRSLSGNHDTFLFTQKAQGACFGFVICSEDDETGRSF